jgi:hypothetical protein
LSVSGKTVAQDTAMVKHLLGLVLVIVQIGPGYKFVDSMLGPVLSGGLLLACSGVRLLLC